MGGDRVIGESVDTVLDWLVGTRLTMCGFVRTGWRDEAALRFDGGTRIAVDGNGADIDTLRAQTPTGPVLVAWRQEQGRVVIVFECGHLERFNVEVSVHQIDVVYDTRTARRGPRWCGQRVA